jgi:hypothetical protein
VAVSDARLALLGRLGGFVLGGNLKKERDIDRFVRIVTIGTTGRFGKVEQSNELPT